jgi:hypothetical protein
VGEGADRYQPGWITKAFLAPKPNAELGNIPRDPIAVYVTTSDPHPFSGYVEHHGLALTDPVAYLREGYLRVTEAGRYSFVSIADHLEDGKRRGVLCGAPRAERDPDPRRQESGRGPRQRLV